MAEMDAQTKVLKSIVAARKQRVKEALKLLEDGTRLAELGLDVEVVDKRRAEFQKEQSMTDEESAQQQGKLLDDLMESVTGAVMSMMDVYPDSKNVNDSKDVLEFIDECVDSGVELAINAHIGLAEEKKEEEDEVAALKRMFNL
jgi:hypothetical protein